MKKFNEELINFIKESSCSYTCIKYIKKVLDSNNYKEITNLNKINNCFYITRNDASIIAISIPKEYNNSFSIITTHCDTPSLLLKPNGSYIKNDYLKYNIMPYGGLLNYGWLDHPLSLAGRLIINKNNKLESKIVDYKKTMLIVPSVAIHQNDSANSNLDLNSQIDLQPILSICNENKFNKLLKNSDIIDYDLFAYNNIEPTVIDNDLLVSPRIDNLTSVYSGLKAFLDSNDKNIKVFCSFNSEEIGSLTQEGADSNFLFDILKKLCSILNIDIINTFSNSFIISSDNTHAVHPNHSEYSDDTGALYLNKGLAIIKEEGSTTNALSSSIIKLICKQNNIKYQVSTSKNDISGGSTLSGISLRHVSILSVDIGIPQLSMHSSIETCSINDVFELYKLMKTFYNSNIRKNSNKIEITSYN